MNKIDSSLPFIPLIKPDIEFKNVADDIYKILKSGQLTSGPYVNRFELEFSDYISTDYAISTTSATTALHLSLAALNIRSGDEVLVSDFTFPATGNAIVQTGASPVMVDCMPERFDIDPQDAAKKLTKSTKAIMVVHPFGQPADMTSILNLARQAGIYVIEDAACAVGTYYNEEKCGSISDCACFSFHPRKILTTGEGGMITTNNPDIYQRLSILKAHGGIPTDGRLSFVVNGFNYRLTEIQAAIGIEQLSRIDKIIEERRKIASMYISFLEKYKYIKIPLSSKPSNCSFQSFVIQLGDKIDRDEVIIGMRKKNIETTIGTYAMHGHPAFERFGYKRGDLPYSYLAERKSLTLPLISGMENETVQRIVDSLVETIEGQ